METATRIRLNDAAPLAATKTAENETAETDLQSIASCVETAVAQITFSAREIEALLALDDPSWRSIERQR